MLDQPPSNSTAPPRQPRVSPWGARLASFLVRPLVATPVTPNHLTTFSLIFSIGACAGFATGHQAWMNAAAGMFMISRVLDNMDGALARAQERSSKFGERYDQIADTLGYALIFIGIAIGLRDQISGGWLLALVAPAVVGGVSNTIIRVRAESRQRRSLPAFRTYAGIELHDGIYLIGPATWLGALPIFFIAICVGAAVYGSWTAWSLIRRQGAPQRQ